MAGENEEASAKAAAFDATGDAAQGIAPEIAPDDGEQASAGVVSPDGKAASEAAVPTGESTEAQAVSEDAGELAESAEAHEPTAEERELAENNALADVFDDVRKQSADSSLVTPDRWAEQGFVPEHMTADEFEMLVYEYLEDYRRDHKDEIAEEKRERAAKRNSVRSATHAVGVPPKIPNRRLAQKEADEEAAREEAAVAAEAEGGQTAPDASSADDAAKAGPASALAADAASVSVSAEPGASTGDAGQAGASRVADTPVAPADAGADPDSDDPFAGLKIPEGYKLVELEGEYVLVPDEDAKPVRKEIHCEHIVTLVGQHSYYLYDSDLMTQSYAHWAFLAAEDNPLATFVDCVREEGRVYPRPLSASDLANEPFRMSASKVEQTWGELVESGDYPDIERCEASNGDVYFFSTLYMTRVLAESLAEYESVERKANV